MSIKKRVENIEKRTKNEADGADIFDLSDPKDRFIKGICDKYNIAPDPKLVNLWRRVFRPRKR